MTAIIACCCIDFFSEHIDPDLPRIEEFAIEILQSLSRTLMLHKLNECQSTVPSLLVSGQLDWSKRPIDPENSVQVSLIQLEVQVVQE